MEMSFAKCPSALKMRLRLASACPSPFAYASLQPEQGPVTYVALRASKYEARNTCVARSMPLTRNSTYCRQIDWNLVWKILLY